MKKRKPYYYQGKEKITLEQDDDYLALDVKAADKHGLSGKAAKQLRQNAIALKNDLLLVERRMLPEDVKHKLEAENLLEDVYRYADSLVVALPEVRVDVKNAKEGKALEHYMKQHSALATLEQRRTDQFVLRPRSGRGTDALNLANTLHEQLKLSGASVRLVRRVPGPGTKKG